MPTASLNSLLEELELDYGRNSLDIVFLSFSDVKQVTLPKLNLFVLRDLDSEEHEFFEHIFANIVSRGAKFALEKLVLSLHERDVPDFRKGPLAYAILGEDAGCLFSLELRDDDGQVMRQVLDFLSTPDVSSGGSLSISR